MKFLRVTTAALCFFSLIFSLAAAASAESLVIDSDMQFAYALQNFNEGDFQTALVEYKRFIHFFPDDPRRMEARFQTGICLYRLKRFREAAGIFNAIILDRTAGKFRDKSVFYQSRAFKGMGNMGYAKISLINYLELSNDPDVRDRLHSALADLCVASFDGTDRQDLSDAGKYLARISEKNAMSYNRDDRVRAVEAALSAPEKSPALSGWLSIVPGAGFFYCERYQDALVAFLLNTGLILAAYESFDKDHAALGSVITFVESGFYAGNIYGAVNAAHRYNRDAKLNILGAKFEVFSAADVEDKAWMIGLRTRF